LQNKKNIKRIGHDKDYEIARRAQKAGALDEIKFNLPASVRDAQIVLLCLPLSGVRETLGFIASDLQEGAVIMDTAPAKATVAAWVRELIPQGRYYVGFSPAAGAGYLHGIDLGVDSARADLFKDGLFLVNAPLGTPGEAVKLATDLVGLLGAQAMLSDEVEADGLLASTHILPQLIAAALLDSTVDQPGWLEARKVAGRPFATATAALTYQDEARSLGEAALGNRENVVRVLNTYVTSLLKLRDEIAQATINPLSNSSTMPSRHATAGSVNAQERTGRTRCRERRIPCHWANGSAACSWVRWGGAAKNVNDVLLLYR
jgi:prephenate dehydrogenase